MTILLTDPRVRAVPVHESSDPLVRLPDRLGADIWVRAGLLSWLSSRFVAPLGVAPHLTGAAVDVTLTDLDGRELDLGTPVDATPEDSDDACWFAAPTIRSPARELRHALHSPVQRQAAG